MEAIDINWPKQKKKGSANRSNIPKISLRNIRKSYPKIPMNPSGIKISLIFAEIFLQNLSYTNLADIGGWYRLISMGGTA
jgi:hypothetical protein